MIRLIATVLALVVAAPAMSQQLANPAALTEQAPPVYKAKFDTSKGPFVIEVHRDWAPLGADRFYNLVRAGYYDDSRFTRVVPNFIAQFGIAGDPAVARLWYGRGFPDDPVKQSNTRGTLAFAMTGPNARTTQIYINLVDDTKLDAQGFAPIGRVIDRMDIVDSLYSGYGESSGGGVRAGHQGPLVDGGNAYADKMYPKLDRLIRITIPVIR
jgi:cyclophilin family peptidyl-prolyl cis-trans isomerase